MSSIRFTRRVAILVLVVMLSWFPVVGGSSSTSLQLEYSIVEGLATGSLVADIRRDAGLGDQFAPDDLNRMRFHFRHAGRGGGSHVDPRDVFSLDESSGEIRTSVVVDREVLCPGDAVSTCNIAFDVTIRPLAYFRVIGVTVRVGDLNDNAPLFPVDHVTLHVTESAAVGTTFLIPSAHDADSGQFGVAKYRLQTDEQIDQLPFELYVIDQVNALYGWLPR